MNERRRLVVTDDIDLNLSGYRDGDTILVTSAAGSLYLPVCIKNNNIPEGDENLSYAYYDNYYNNLFFSNVTLNWANALEIEYNANYSTSNQNGGYLVVTYKNKTITIYITLAIDATDGYIYVTENPTFVPVNIYPLYWWDGFDFNNITLTYLNSDIPIKGKRPMKIKFSLAYKVYNSGNILNIGMLERLLRDQNSAAPGIYIGQSKGAISSYTSVAFESDRLNNIRIVLDINNLNNYINIGNKYRFCVHLLNGENLQLVIGNTYYYEIYLKGDNNKWRTVNSVQYSMYVSDYKLPTSGYISGTHTLLTEI